MRRLLLGVAVLLTTPSYADIPPDEPPTMPSAECVGKAAGERCGSQGRCEQIHVRRPDFSNGTPPTWRLVPVMICNELPPNDRSSRAAWALLAGVLALLGLRVVRQPSVAPRPARSS